MFKRIGLFLCINFVVLITIGFLVRLFGVEQWLTREGINYEQLLTFSAILGFTGSFISLMMSKTLAKLSVGAKVISEPQTQEEIWLMKTVDELADAAGIKRPEVAIYSGSANAFATGAFKDEALVAVSTGLMQSMTRSQIRAVLAHELSHVKNGDMVTMTLVQGVLNTFVFFFARVVTVLMHSSKNDDRRRSNGVGYYFTVQIFELLFGILASIIAFSFSRHREYKADAGASELLGGPEDMIDALRALGTTDVKPLPSEMKAFGIVDIPSSFSELFSTHPSLQNRIKALSGNRATQEAVVRKKLRTGGVFGSVSSDKKTPWN